MRTDSETQHALYNDLTLKEAAERLGVSAELVLALGEAGEVEVRDYRLKGAKRGVYRVSAASVDKLRAKRLVKAQSA
jgi:hypothetical protein